MSVRSWHPEIFAKRRPFLERRAAIVKATRAWFDGRGFVEVETPCLQISPGMEPHLKAFETRIVEPFNADGSLMFLHTSPEFAMKKLLAAGMPRIFQMSRCFRNEERSDTHHPEFTMLEWYRAGENLDRLMEDCQELLQASLAASGRERFDWQGNTCDPCLPARRLRVSDAFLEYAGIDLDALISDADEPDPRPLAEAARVIGLSPHDSDRWEDIFFRIFLDRIETKLGIDAPTFLTDYPVCMAALAKPQPNDRRIAQRFELYVCGLELANAFAELTDSMEQARRFGRDQHLRQELYGLAYPVDAEFIEAVGMMPECSGIALGFDRLALLAAGGASIDDVLWLPVAGP